MLAFVAGCLAGATSTIAQDTPANDLYWLTQAEKEWLAGREVIRNGVIRNHEPFEFVDDEGQHDGLTSDYMAILAERLNVRLDTVVVNSFSELGSGLQNGDIDIASYLPMSANWAEVLAFSEPMISIPIAVFGDQNADLVLDLPALAQWRVAVERPSRAYEILTRESPELELVFVDSPEDGLIAIAEGEVDYFVHNIFSVEYYQRKLELDAPKLVLMTPYSFDIRFSASREMAPLIPIAHTVLASMGDHERTLIFDKWVNLQVAPGFQWQKVAAWGTAILAVILVTLSFIILWNRRLAHEVDSRTRDLEESKDALRALAVHMDNVREEERSRLALEMHDELGHSLTALAMAIRRLANYRKRAGDQGGDDPDEESQIEELRQLVRDASQTSRRIMSDLRPSVLEDLGLVAAIDWLAHEFEAHYEMPCDVDAEDLAIELPPGAGIALFRIVQESLTNIARHADATRASIDLNVLDGALSLAIRDDGKGIAGELENSERSFGLLGMRERALAVGATFGIDSSDGNGTTVQVTLAL